ncbi:MAG: alanine racemase [Clostridia bacterium]|nr:alanine racemase [Clostridia bacterium]
MRVTRALISLEAIGHNTRYICNSIGDTKMLAIIKANAYGHGAVPVAKKMLECGAYALGVATFGEAEELRAAGIDAPVLIIGALSAEECAQCVGLDIAACVYMPEQVEAMEQAAVRENKQAKAHLKVDSGFHRIGMMKEEAPALIDAFRKAPHVTMEGLFTHFASADMADDSFVDEQVAVFNEVEALVHEAGFTPLCHISNSAATLRRKNLRKDMVRCGIILYGCLPSFETGMPEALRPALTLCSKVQALRTIGRGESVGYGREFIAPDLRRIATIPVGYADGYSRLLSQKADVLIGGQRCPIVGRVCMDHLMVDVTALPEVSVGDDVVLIGAQGNEMITADELGELRGSVGYEVLVNIAERVPREYV